MLTISSRIKITILLVVSAVILAFIPTTGKYSMHENSYRILQSALDQQSYLSPDQVAKAIATNDSTIRIIDLRSKSDFIKYSIPGTINIPYVDLLKADLESLLNSGHTTVFISDSDADANYAYVLSQGLGYHDCKVMKGGLNEWIRIVMNSSFIGERISAKENALFETRFKIRTMVNEFNNMPDSLKIKYQAIKEIERRKLDGGCE